MLVLTLVLLAQTPQSLLAPKTKPQTLDRAYVVGVLGDYDSDRVADYGVAGCVRDGGERHFVVRVFSGADDRQLIELATPSAPTYSGQAQITALADLDGDGRIELAALGGQGWLLSPRTGRVLHDFGLGSEIVGVLGDVDGDGALDLLVDTYLDPATNPHGGTFVRQAWSSAKSSVIAGVELPRRGWTELIDDVDGDGVRELAVFEKGDAWFRVLSGKDAHELLSVAMPARGERVTPRWIASLPGHDLLLVGDSDRASKKSDDGSPAALARISLTKRELVFAHPFDFELADDEHGGCGAFRAALLGDLNADGVADFAVAVPSYKFTGPSQLAALSGADGSTLWSSADITAEELNPSVDALSDRDGDGVPDLLVSIAGEGHGLVAIVSGRTGELLKQFTP